MRKWMAIAAATALLAISGGVAFASWGGGTGSDAVSVTGTAELVDTKYYIDGDLTALCDPNIVCNVTDDEGSGRWLLDFGAQNYYLDNPDPCANEVANFLATLDSQHTIQGKLARHGEIDVYVVDGCDIRSGEEGGSPPWADSDSDGFDDLVEAYVGTDPLDDCADDPTDDAWPPDFDDNQTVDIADMLALKPVFGTAVPPTSARFDLFPGGDVNVADVLALKPFFGESCT